MRPLRVIAVVAAVAAPATVLGAALFLQVRAARSEVPAPAAASPVKPGSWEEVEKLVSDQKLEAAATAVLAIETQARSRNDAAEWGRALVRETELRIALGGFETAVETLSARAWPETPVEIAALRLYRARALVEYLAAYGWEIGQREKVVGDDTVDLKQWTKAQIVEAATRDFAAVFAVRDRLGGLRVRDFSYLSPNDYPEGIRPTVRDAVSYLFAAHLADSSLWSAAESNGVYRLDPARLLGSDLAPTAAFLAGAGEHPLTKAAAALADLEAWHAGRKETGAALEAKLERFRLLHANLTAGADRATLRKVLAEALPRFRNDSWWSMGIATLAGFVREEAAPDHLVRARDLALEGERAFPASYGARYCQRLREEIEAPAFDLQSMAVDGAAKRSLEITHKNFAKIFLRAYRIDPLARLAQRDFRGFYPSDPQETKRLVERGHPVAAWSVELPATPDYEMHRTFAVPPLAEAGAYALAASAREDFSFDRNRVQLAGFLVSDLVLHSETAWNRASTLTLVSGASGAPLAGVELAVYHHDWRTPPALVGRPETDADGRATVAADTAGGATYVVARRGNDIAFTQVQGGNYWNEQGETESALVFTDRAIYRPGQKLLWKVLVYAGDPRRGALRLEPRHLATLELMDPNGEKVAETTVSTNDFGTVAGEFTIPPGRLLGDWQLRTSPNGWASVAVEEYKRPTFEVAMKPPVGELRLNRPAKLSGEARYYFGLPVASGSVAWRVTREPELPWWWCRCGFEWGLRPSGREAAEVIATGNSSLDADGRFEVPFLPAADEREKDSGMTYRYRLQADVTDDGGETRTGDTTVRLGWVAVEATLDFGAEELPAAGRPLELHSKRSDLSGTPRAGEGAYSLVALVQPERAPLPAEVPIPVTPGASSDRYLTLGDRLRPRWTGTISPEEILRGWADGRKVAEGKLLHGANGDAHAPLPALASGAYRIRYETRDSFGERFKAERAFYVTATKPALAVPLALAFERSAVEPGGTARLLWHSGIPGQTVFLEIVRGNEVRRAEALVAGRDKEWIELPIGAGDRGGFAVHAWLVADHQLVDATAALSVPWIDKQLSVDFSTFRDKLRPGGRETFRVTVKDARGKPVEAGAAEILASMYDQSLDFFRAHSVPQPWGLFPGYGFALGSTSTLGQAQRLAQFESDWIRYSNVPGLSPDTFIQIDPYGIGGPGARRYRGFAMMEASAAPGGAPPPAPQSALADHDRLSALGAVEKRAEARSENQPQRVAETVTLNAAAPVELRSNFAETAFWQPHLVTGPGGSAAIEFELPDSVTNWKVWASAVTRDLASGYVEREARSVKDLMVRPYLPRFLREGDRAELKVVVNDASDRPLAGELALAIVDPDTGEDLAGEFGLAPAALARHFDVAAGKGTNVTFSLAAPRRVGPVAFRIVARSGDLSDGELRPLPILPSRIHLAQSRFVVLHDRERREMTFADMKAPDPTRINEKLVVTVDGQLFFQVLDALPYLVSYPYECTEQTLNRFLSSGILSSLFDRYPAVAKMAAELAKRETQFERFDAYDPNRKMALEETPWLQQSRGKSGAENVDLLRVLDPRVAVAERTSAIAKLQKAQLPSGAFPWFPGGPPSPYMTLYLMYGMAKAAEFSVPVPKEMVVSGWRYLDRTWREEWWRDAMAHDCCWEMLTFFAYVATSYPDASWTGGVLSDADLHRILDFSFKHWRQHSPMLKLQLAMTLHRTGRDPDARLVLASVMDSAKSERDLGTFWQPEDRAWLWYNDTIETHAWAIRALLEIEPKDPRLPGLVQWLFLNKKLNHWKSTRATAEVLYSLARYLQHEGALAVREVATVEVAAETTTFTFEPDAFTGKKNQIVVAGEKLVPERDATVVVAKETPGLLFASATWHFSTEELPKEARGDLFSVTRRYFKRVKTGEEATLVALGAGSKLEVGDEVEVQLSLKSKAAAEYVHLRDPRPAGLEPDRPQSGWRWNLGIAWYEETRDSGANFFFESLPAGDYPFNYRVRVATAGEFRAAPAEVQSMYAPEFVAYSAGETLSIGSGGK